MKLKPVQFFILLSVIVLLGFMAKKISGPDMLIMKYDHTVDDMISPEHVNGNTFDSSLTLATQKVVMMNPGLGKKHFVYLIRGKLPQTYNFKSYKSQHPDDLVIEYNQGYKLAAYTNSLPTPAEMKAWDIKWDKNPPKVF